jgi:FKBP-type peptidyl-prolyl cis-trans isomerase FklB
MRNALLERRFSAFSLAAAMCALALMFAGNASPRQSQTPAAAPATKTAKPASTASSAPKSQTPATKSTTAAPALTTDKQKISYALGANIGRQLASDGVNASTMDSATFLRGVRDELQGSKPLLTDDQIKTELTQLQGLIEEANLNEGQEFLTKNKTKEGVVALPSGLQYKVITMGTGPKPTASDTVVCDYRGTLINGKEFDSSYKRGQTASFGVGQVIKGWTEALQLMPVGSKWQLFVPADLAYGVRSPSPDIPPNSVLIFEVELHAIKGK